jgi:hypothetical protein
MSSMKFPAAAPSVGMSPRLYQSTTFFEFQQPVKRKKGEFLAMAERKGSRQVMQVLTSDVMDGKLKVV